MSFKLCKFYYGLPDPLSHLSIADETIALFNDRSRASTAETIAATHSMSDAAAASGGGGGG